MTAAPGDRSMPLRLGPLHLGPLRPDLIQPGLGIVAVVGSIVVPAAIGSGYWTHNFLVVNLFITVAVLQNLLLADAGQVSFGQGAVFGLSAFTVGIVAGLWSSRLRHMLPWTPISFTFHRLDGVPFVGHGLTIVAMIMAPLFIHDCWFYWSHRIEHKVPILWEFHKIHHSDERMNTSTWARDHFLQESWRSFFSVFTLGYATSVANVQVVAQGPKMSRQQPSLASSQATGFV